MNITTTVHHLNVIPGAVPAAHHGFTQVPNSILRDAQITVGAKTVYALLLSYAWKNDFRHPNQEQLANDLGMGTADVEVLIEELVRCGLLTITRSGHGRGELYTINFSGRASVQNLIL